MLTSKILTAEKWLAHGFGTRREPDLESEVCHLTQVHGVRVIVVKEGDTAPKDKPEADSLATNQKGLKIGVRTADCVPILLADPVQKVVAAVHAGWKGTTLNAVGEAVGVLGKQFSIDPKNLKAAIGPCIRSCCFEVGKDRGERFFVDLQQTNRHQLLESGVLDQYIEILPECTYCRTDLLYSFRRGDEKPRQMSFIGIL